MIRKRSCVVRREAVGKVLNSNSLAAYSTLRTVLRETGGEVPPVYSPGFMEYETNVEKMCTKKFIGAVVLKVNRKIDVAVNKYLRFVWAYLFTATLLLYRSSLRTIFLSKNPVISD